MEKNDQTDHVCVVSVLVVTVRLVDVVVVVVDVDGLALVLACFVLIVLVRIAFPVRMHVRCLCGSAQRGPALREPLAGAPCSSSQH